MTASPLSSALRAGADGLYALEAATGLVIAHGSWLIREDFARFIHRGAGTAAIDWTAAMTALDEGSLPGSGGERRMLELAASLAGHRPVILGDAIPGIHDRNLGVLVKAVLHASGQRQFPSPRLPRRANCEGLAPTSRFTWRRRDATGSLPDRQGAPPARPSRRRGP
jgi:hypothetical protein